MRCGGRNEKMDELDGNFEGLPSRIAILEYRAIISNSSGEDKLDGDADGDGDGGRTDGRSFISVSVSLSVY